MWHVLRSRLPEVLRAMAPLVGSVCVLQVLLVQAPLPEFLRFLAGTVLAVVGMLLLLAGVDQGILPMGRFIGAELPRKGSRTLIAAVAAALGFVTTAAEPDVLILADQVRSIAGVVGLFSAAAMWAIARGRTLTPLLAVSFALMIGLSLVAAPQFVPLAYDAGSVTTGVLSGPVLLALGLGLSAVLARHPGSLDGFGLLGLASTGPVVVVLLVGWLR